MLLTALRPRKDIDCGAYVPPISIRRTASESARLFATFNELVITVTRLSFILDDINKEVVEESRKIESP